MKKFNLLQQGFHQKSKTIVCALSLTLFGQQIMAGELEQAKRIHDRLIGVPPSEAVLLEMRDRIVTDGDGVGAALWAIDHSDSDDFYNVTLRNWITPWTNEEFSVFTPLNDYTTTLIGVIRDETDFRQAFYDDVVYVGRDGLGLPAYQMNNNQHYEQLAAGLERNSDKGFSLKDDITRVTQTSVTQLPREAVSGVITSRAASMAFFSGGTNRANFRFTMLNQLCLDMEQVHDTTLAPDRIRQDVSRSPGGDARVFLNTCLGCHSGMDPMAQAFAYHDWVYNEDDDSRPIVAKEDGFLEYIGNAPADPDTGFAPVQPKYLINAATFPDGYITPNSQWDNYWREGQNANLGWDSSLPGSGDYAWQMVQELVHTRAFAECQVKKAFKAVCLRDPHSEEDNNRIFGEGTGLVDSFMSSNFNMKRVFAETADYCKGE